jgi:hypothetical protein
MRNRRLAIAGLALVAALGLTGCGPSDSAGGSGTPAAEQTSAPADPAAELAAAATKLSGESLKIKLESAGLNAEGIASADGTQMDMTMKLGLGGSDDSAMKMRKVGDDLYIKMGGALGKAIGADADKWMHVDASKLSPDHPFAMNGGNPKDASKMIAATTNVEKTGEGAYKGVLDMTKTPNANQKSMETLGEKAKAVPFTAKVDAEGRLTELVIDADAMMPGAGKMTTAYYDFGTPVSVKAPAAKDVKEMPKALLGAANA